MQLRSALATASPALQSQLYNGVDNSIRYERYTDALMALDQIGQDPSLTDQQKKMVGQVIELLKAKVQGQPGAAKPGA